jgi:hypothetical protein
MKKVFIILLIAIFGINTSFAQEQEEKRGPELKLSGEVKTGIFWTQTQYEGRPATSEVKLHSKDDAGGGQGRYRLNLDYDNGNGFGMRTRIEWENWGANEKPPWKYAFGYGNFFEDQMTVSIGKLGGSPWGTGGPESWKELESMHEEGGGMRVEWKPGFIPVGKLNVGFVLNWFNGVREDNANTDPTLLDILEETVVGASYIHDLFMVRAAYRFDSPYDLRARGVLTDASQTEGGDILYRVEEHVLSNYLSGLSVWALGYLQGVGASLPECKNYLNWLFVQYAPEQFTAQIRFGWDYIEKKSVLYVKPSFYWNFFDRLLSAGASFMYGQDFGDNKVFPGSPFLYMEVEPRIQLNFSSSYIAFAYNFRRDYVNPATLPEARGKDPIKQTQWMNLRFCIYY